MLPELFLDGQRAIANVKSIAQTLESMPDPSAVGQYDGTQAGLGRNYGVALEAAAEAMSGQLQYLQKLLATHADALKASIDALSETDAMAGDEADALRALIDDAASAPSPASSSGRTGGMQYKF